MSKRRKKKKIYWRFNACILQSSYQSIGHQHIDAWIFFGERFYECRCLFFLFLFCNCLLFDIYAAYVIIPLSVPFYIPNYSSFCVSFFLFHFFVGDFDRNFIIEHNTNGAMIGQINVTMQSIHLAIREYNTRW